MPGVSKLTVEVSVAENGNAAALFPAIVEDIKPETDSVFLKFEQDWRPEAWYSYNDILFEAPPRHSIEEIKERLAVAGGSVEALYRVKQGAPEGWYQGQVVAESRPGLFTVDLNLTPPRRVNVPIEQLRFPHSPVRLTKHSIHRVQFVVPENALNEATSDRHLAMFAEYGKFDYVRYDAMTKNIIVMVYGQAGIHRAEILAEMHLNHAAYRQSFLDEIARLKLELFGTVQAEQAGTIRIEFNVPVQHILRLWGGHQQPNLTKARNIHGITRISVDNSGHVTIMATSEEAGKQAQEMLEFVTDVIYVDPKYVGHVIGKAGSQVQEIMRTSNVYQVNFCHGPEVLRSYSALFEWREGLVPLVLLGVRADTDAAKMLIEYQIDHTRQMDEERRLSLLPERRGHRDQLSRQHTDEQRESVDHGLAGGKLTESPLKDAAAPPREPHGGRNSVATETAAPPTTGNRGHRGPPPRRDAPNGLDRSSHGRKDHQGGHGGLPRREEPLPLEDKRNGQSEGVMPSSKEWPELGGQGGRRSSQPDGQHVNSKDVPCVAPGEILQQNGIVNGHSEHRPQNHQAGSGRGAGNGHRGGPGAGGRHRGGRGGYQRLEEHSNDGGRREVSKPHGDPLPNGRGEEVDGEGFQSVSSRNKRHSRHPRGGGHGVANGIRPAPEESAENRREDQVSR